MSRIERVVREVWTEAFSFSDIPENLHDKVRAQVPVKSFLKNGVFDGNAFAAAVEVEIKEWDRLLTPHVMGCGFTITRDTSGKRPMTPKMQEREDEKWIQEMLELGGQPE
ncbi:MAG: hypothetical protein ISS59_01005 [Desulfobacteraceae bacterium]|nr:hypothetical protein [Desulfobacteraceae bacterium]